MALARCTRRRPHSSFVPLSYCTLVQPGRGALDDDRRLLRKSDGVYPESRTEGSEGVPGSRSSDSLSPEGDPDGVRLSGGGVKRISSRSTRLDPDPTVVVKFRLLRLVSNFPSGVTFKPGPRRYPGGSPAREWILMSTSPTVSHPRPTPPVSVSAFPSTTRVT